MTMTQTAAVTDPVSTCRTCGREIRYTTVEEPGYLPRTGWSDGFPRDALVCFSALNLTHKPTQEPS